MKAECIFRANALVGENPTWDWRTGHLYWVQSRDGLLARMDPATGEARTWPLSEFTGSFALTQDRSKALLGMRSGASVLDLDRGTLEPYAPAPYDPERFHLNDGHCDRAGVFVIGSSDRRKNKPSDRTNSFYQVSGGAFRPLVPEVSIANGLAFSPDNKTLYRSEFFEGVILAYDYDSAAGRVSNRRTFAKIPDGMGMPDGAAVDQEGNYWIALFDGGRVARINREGKIDREVMVGAKQPTMVAFGGPDFRTVYVTSAQYPAPSPDLGEDAGGIFSFQADVPGLPEVFATL